MGSPYCLRYHDVEKFRIGLFRCSLFTSRVKVTSLPIRVGRVVPVQVEISGRRKIVGLGDTICVIWSVRGAVLHGVGGLTGRLIGDAGPALSIEVSDASRAAKARPAAGSGNNFGFSVAA